MRKQTIQIYLNTNDKLEWLVNKPSEDIYEDTNTEPLAGLGFYHFNPDIYTLKEAKEALLSARSKALLKQINILCKELEELNRLRQENSNDIRI